MSRHLLRFLVPLALSPGAVSPARAQQAHEVVLGAGGGQIYDCHDQCDMSTSFTALFGYSPTRVLVIGADLRLVRRQTFSAPTYFLGEIGVQLRAPGQVVNPFVGFGTGYSGSPFIGNTPITFFTAAGIGVWPVARWGVRAEGRLRAFADEGLLGEVTLALTYRVVLPAP